MKGSELPKSLKKKRKKSRGEVTAAFANKEKECTPNSMRWAAPESTRRTIVTVQNKCTATRKEGEDGQGERRAQKEKTSGGAAPSPVG